MMTGNIDFVNPSLMLLFAGIMKELRNNFAVMTEVNLPQSVQLLFLGK